MNIVRRSRALKGALVATAVAVATATVAGTASAAGAGTAELPVQPTFEMYGANKQTQELQVWFPVGNGGFETVGPLGNVSDIADIIVADNDNDGHGEAEWTVYKNGRLDFWSPDSGSEDTDVVGRGWNIYATVLSPGNIGGAKQADLLGVDKTGVLWSYLAYPNGTLTPRVRVGGGWNTYSQIAGQGDLTGDGKPDVVARDKTGVLWLYKGTGNYKAPFTGRTKIGSGWNTYDRVLSTGDIDLDGKADLLARKSNGDLFRYPGTGNASAPFKAPVRIGGGYQKFNLF
ncbi:VCBS repeat-containing protein [Streptomyces sp. NBC_00250]|uniref:FG-GAP repeat domain-containing protein n=1 Tax=Streptomyces sp. NBC_00250 TaxID=2903641 RepID=UPI002E2D3138|nr:VCBS repeat-containing protein [Streptomyces sp. NBC_00250]